MANNEFTKQISTFYQTHEGPLLPLQVLATLAIATARGKDCDGMKLKMIAELKPSSTLDKDVTTGEQIGNTVTISVTPEQLLTLLNNRDITGFQV